MSLTRHLVITDAMPDRFARLIDVKSAVLVREEMDVKLRPGRHPEYDDLLPMANFGMLEMSNALASQRIC